MRALDFAGFGPCRAGASVSRPRADAKGNRAPLGRGYLSYGTGVSRAGQTGGRAVGGGRIDGDTLLFGRQRLANIGQETWMGRAELGVVHSRFFEAQLAVHGEAHFGGVMVFLAVVFPPADRAELECRRRFESLRSAARATVASCNRIRLHVNWTRKCTREITRKNSP